MLQVIQPVVPMLEKPDASSTQTSQCLYGERVELLEQQSAYVRVRNLRDGYAGYVSVNAVVDEISSSTHWVNQRSTPLFSSPDIKSPIVARVPFSAELSAQPHDARFLRTDRGLFAISSHCSEFNKNSSFVALANESVGPQLVDRQGMAENSELVELAEALFDGCPYIWGGRSPDGCDCSGLLQLSAYALGVLLPRDSGPQENSITTQVSFAARHRNDIVFWSGHVGILKDANTLYHATAHSMLTVTESLQSVIDRAGPATSVRRL